MPDSPVQEYLESLFERHRGLTDGKVADYIPELGGADPDLFGLCIATQDGFVYEVGDAREPFTIQSVSKPFTYGLALEQRGESAVLEKIGVEPSGDVFNAISLNPVTGTPLNPLINAGAIAICGLIDGGTVQQKTASILNVFSRYAGRTLDIDQAVYRSESETGHRNRAIGWMLRNFSVLPGEPTSTLEAYFQQCSIRVTCRDLAIMGATLANGGVNPVTHVRALQEAYVQNVLSVMGTCGMYDATGQWFYRAGLPAKSGVSGGILAVQPGRLGIAVFSPRIVAQGNSVRGMAVCRDLATELGLHPFAASLRATPTVRLSTTRRSVASKQRRGALASEQLKGLGRRIRLYHLQGALVFASVEQVIRRIMERFVDTECFIANLRLVQGINRPAARMLAGAQATLQRQGKTLIFAETGTWWQSLIDVGVAGDTFFADDDFALEYAENRLLAEHCPELPVATHVPLAQCVLLSGMAADEVALLDRLMERRSYSHGQRIIGIGQASDELFVITDGAAMVSLPTHEAVTRLDALTAGMTFGEMAFIDRSPRSANVTALAFSECRVLTRQAFARLDREAPAVKIRLLENIARGLTGVLRQVGRELAALR